MKIRYAILGTLLLVLALALAACAGAEGPAGPAGPEGPAGPAGAAGPAGPAGAPGEAAQMPEPEFVVQPETCSICHSGAGGKHQASYDELYQDGVIQVADLDYRYSAGSHIVTFKTTKNGAPFNANDAELSGHLLCTV